jgi:DNA-binding NtrC family response regulator
MRKEQVQLLIVDDDDATRVLLRKILSHAGYRLIDEAASGPEALARLANRPYQVVLLDWNMPRMSGLDVLREAKPRYPDCEFLMITARDSVDSVIDAMRLGALGFLSKPLENLQALIDKVASAIERVQARIEVHRAMNQLRDGAPGLAALRTEKD